MLRDPATDGVSCRIMFSSEQLPTKLEPRGRSLWRNLYSELYGPLEVKYARDRPFSAKLESTRLGSLGLTTCVSTVESFVRTPRCVVAAGSDNFHLAVNLGGRPMLMRQLGRETLFEPGAMALVTDSEPGEFAAGAGNRWLFLTMPARRLADLVGGAENSVAAPLGHDQPAMRHLRRYLDIVLGPERTESDTALEDHIETTLLDLTALVLGVGRERADLARQRGRRAARLRMILAAISKGFEAPDFSVNAVAARVGLSPRYVQDLLHETGSSLTERVLERRLQRARQLLTDPGSSDRRIIDIALSSGFNEISYFNRAFRRRFGVSPTDMRRAAELRLRSTT